MINGKNRTVEAFCRAATIENTLIIGQTSRLIVSLSDRFVTPKDVLERRGDVRCTNGSYFVKYDPPGNYAHDPRCPYIIGNDLVGFYLRVSGPDHFERLRNVYPEVDWMLRHTNYDPQLFGVAKIHPGMILSFCVNWVEYFDKIKAQIVDKGLDYIKVKPLVTFKVSRKIKTYDIDDTTYRPDRATYHDKIEEAKKLV